MTLLQHYQLSLLFICAVSIGVGLWIWVRKRQSKVAQLLCLYFVLVGFWSWCQSQIGATTNPQTALAWGRAMFGAVVVFPVLLTHFFAAFLEVDRRKVCTAGWVLTLGFWPFIWTDRFLLSGASLSFLPTFPRGSALFLPFNLAWLAWICYNFFWLLARGPYHTPSPTKTQIKLLLVAFISAYLTGCVNYLYFYGICFSPLQPFATYLVSIGIFTIVYGVFAYGLFDIQVVIRRSVVYSVLVTLLTVGYFGLVYAIERFFSVTLGYQSVWLSLAAFAVMALLFQPLKVGIQRVVDRLFFRTPHEELVKRMERLEQEVRHADKLKAVSILAAGLAHEIKNPLASLKTFTAYLPEKTNDPAFQQKFQRIVTQEVDKIDHIVRRLLDFAKPAPPNLEPVPVSRLLDETLDFLNSEAVKRHVAVERRYACTDPIQADSQQLRQVFLNLVLNSFEAMTPPPARLPEGPAPDGAAPPLAAATGGGVNGAGGQLSVRIERNGSHVVVTIADTGPGIPKEHLTHIFDPFFTTKSNGTGLGLSIVQSIITDHRGTIAFTSEPPRGTTCTLTFPLDTPSAASAEHRTTSP